MSASASIMVPVRPPQSIPNDGCGDAGDLNGEEHGANDAAEAPSTSYSKEKAFGEQKVVRCPRMYPAWNNAGMRLCAESLVAQRWSLL